MLLSLQLRSSAQGAFFHRQLHSSSSMCRFLDDKLNKPELLFPGVGCFLIAVLFGVGVHIQEKRLMRIQDGMHIVKRSHAALETGNITACFSTLRNDSSVSVRDTAQLRATVLFQHISLITSH